MRINWNHHQKHPNEIIVNQTIGFISHFNGIVKHER